MHADFEEIERKLAHLERDFVAALKHCHGGDTRPASIDLTVH